MNNGAPELTSEQKEYARGVIQDPALFASQVLGVDLWAREVEIVQTIKSHRRTAIKACTESARPSPSRSPPCGGWRGTAKALCLPPRPPCGRYALSSGLSFTGWSITRRCRFRSSRPPS